MNSQKDFEGSQIKLPGPGEDATPCLIRCYVGKSDFFRSLREFERAYRPLYEEFKFYVWRSITLREIATLLFIRDPFFNFSPFLLHAFRIVRLDGETGYYYESESCYNITRISSTQFSNAKKDVQAFFSHDHVPNEKDAENAFETVMQESVPCLPEESDEEAAKKTLESMGWKDGDILECIVYESRRGPGRHRNERYERGSNDLHRSRGNSNRSRDRDGRERRSSEHHFSSRR